MTRAEWDALDARAKDAVVAEKVMGWRMVHHVWPDGVPEDWIDVGEGRRRYLAFLPTTSWDAMREVVRKMRGEGWFIEITSRPEPYNDAEAVLCRGFYNRLPIKPMIYADGPAEPEAVCLAALIALGEIKP